VAAISEEATAKAISAGDSTEVLSFEPIGLMHVYHIHVLAAILDRKRRSFHGLALI
jgi:hypothetical protein